MAGITRCWTMSIVLVLLACASVIRAGEQPAQTDQKAKQRTAQGLATKPKASQPTGVKKTDTDREIKMIMLNQRLNKKGQPVTQLTNVISNKHDTARVIIKNVK